MDIESTPTRCMLPLDMQFLSLVLLFFIMKTETLPQSPSQSAYKCEQTHLAKKYF